MMRVPRCLALSAALSLCLLGELAASATEPAENWVERSDAAANLYLEMVAEYSPEGVGFLGLEGYDEKIFSLPLDVNERSIADTEEVVAMLEKTLSAEEHPAMRQDLEILIRSGRDEIAETRIDEQYMLPYFNLAETIFQGLRTLLDDQVAPERRQAAVVRLQRYTGMEAGYVPLTEQAIAYSRARLDDTSLLGPFAGELERDLGNVPQFVDGIAQLFAAYEIEGWERGHELLSAQLDEYTAFVRAEILPRARQDYRLPPEVYASNLRGFGVDLSVEELISRAKVAFREIQNEMQSIAGQIAKERDLEDADYRDLIRDLKEEQLVGDEILAHYQARMQQIEELIRKHEIVTLPDRKMRIRVASEAESAATPAPSMRPPRLIGNTGEMGEFVLPLRIPGAPDEETLQFDDFTFEAASWTLSVHEGRPGHELQFASIVEKGLSLARALFAFNSTNVEGWALYAEAEMKPYLPLDGQLISLQHRLLRAARAFLDPSLQTGAITPEEAQRVLEEEVVVSKAAATSEVERYTFRAPGQATSYFTGYQRLMELRTDVERALGESFVRKDFHDFVLTQGLLPPALLRNAVMGEFVPAVKKAALADS